MSRPAAPVVWFEILVRDLDAAARFYGSLFGWEFQPFTEYDSDYWIIKGDEKGLGGALVRAPGNHRGESGTVVFIAVDDLQDTVHRAVQLGAEVVQEPKDITQTSGRFALLNDPQGNRIGLWSR